LQIAFVFAFVFTITSDTVRSFDVAPVYALLVAVSVWMTANHVRQVVIASYEHGHCVMHRHGHTQLKHEAHGTLAIFSTDHLA
jgi:hypothetical protein